MEAFGRVWLVITNIQYTSNNLKKNLIKYNSKFELQEMNLQKIRKQISKSVYRFLDFAEDKKKKKNE